ncbi:hypothetical protein IAU60_006013 [Kwoniella sp. DSM 27419]
MSPSSSTALQPTLYSVLPASLHPSLTAHISLEAIHIEPLHTTERLYRTTNPVVPGQLRNLRFRSILRSRSGGILGSKGKAKASFEGPVDAETWDHELAYISAPLRGAEYSEACTRAVIPLDVQGTEDEADLEAFTKALGFEHSHSYRLTGLLFHLPLPVPSSPPLTLQLSLTHLDPISLGIKATSAPPDPTRPYFAQLHPSRPVHAVPSPGDVGLSDVVEYMRQVAGRIDGLEWSTAAQ